MMLSMTGFGKAEGHFHSIHFTVELKSVNNRFLDVSTIIPRKVAFLESPVREYLQKNMTRGKILFVLNLTGDTGEISHYQLNEKLLIHLLSLTHELNDAYDISGQVTISDILAREDIVELQEAELEEEALKDEILKTTAKAIDHLKDMQKEEGDFLREQFLKDMEIMEEHIGIIEAHQRSNLENHVEGMKSRVKKLFDQYVLDEIRMYQEMALLGDKLDISEEIQRFKSHLKQFRTYLDFSESAGKRMNFLLQEMHREINTLGNKVANAVISQRVVELKNRIEMIREQVQNIQ
jgi:uncharacterized protein (TIGR00255 family)